MDHTRVVICTCANSEEAGKLAHALVELHLAACVNILPGVESVYRWNGKVETASEFLLLIKTTAERFPALREKITELHSYDTPEILAFDAAAGLSKYLAWVAEQVS